MKLVLNLVCFSVAVRACHSCAGHFSDALGHSLQVKRLIPRSPGSQSSRSYHRLETSPTKGRPPSPLHAAPPEDPPSPRPPSKAQVELKSADGGSVFVKVPQAKSTYSPNGRRKLKKSVASSGKVSAGGVSPPGGQITASAEGRNVGVVLDIPSGGNGYIQTSTGGRDLTRTNHGYTDGPMRLRLPPNYGGGRTSVVAGIDGPGKVKAKAWD